MSHITGRAFISANGQRFKSRPGATMERGGIKRTSVIGDDGVHGYTEEWVAPRIEFTISHDQATKMKELGDMTDVSIIFETDNGRSYIQSPSWITDTLTLNAQDGGVPLAFEGERNEEL